MNGLEPCFFNSVKGVLHGIDHASLPAHVAERAALGIPPLPLSAKQTGELIELLKNPRRAKKPPGRADHPPRARRCGRCRQGQGQLPGRRGPWH